VADAMSFEPRHRGTTGIQTIQPTPALVSGARAAVNASRGLHLAFVNMHLPAPGSLSTLARKPRVRGVGIINARAV